MKKPHLILHPGFPKCATSTIQRLFMLDDFALGKALDLQVITRDFKVYNGYPDVSKLMYQPEVMQREIEDSTLSPDLTYFLSNEALSNNLTILAALADRFDITRTIMTVRFPPLHAISHFCFSQWIDTDFQTYMGDVALGELEAITRFRPQLESFKPFCKNVLVCPTEGVEASLETRFLQMSFDRVPDLLNQPPFTTKVRSNASICLAFAEALAEEIASLSLVIPGPQRKKLVEKAQALEIPESLSKLTIPAIGDLTTSDFDRSLLGYRELLEDFGLPATDVEAAVSVTRKELETLLDAPVATPNQMAELRGFASDLCNDLAGA